MRSFVESSPPASPGAPARRPRSALAVGLLALWAAPSGGCLATGARLRVGPVVDSQGRAAVQADIAVGLGYATTDHSGVLVHVHGGGGSRDRLAIGEEIEYVAHSDRGYGWRAGVGGSFAPLDDRVRGWALGAVTYPLRVRRDSGGHEKMWQSRSESRWSLGLEGRVGMVGEELGEGAPDERSAAAFGAAATLEWNAFTRVH